MIYIVEGIDRVGKSTLVDRFCKDMNIKCFRGNDTDFFSLDNLDNINETDKCLKLIKMSGMFNLDVVFDRLYWSDFVYGCAERHYDFTQACELFEKIENELIKYHAMIVLVKPTNLEWSSRKHGKDLTLHSKLYDLAYSMSKIDKIECDYTSLSDAENIMKNKIKKSISEGAKIL